MVIILPAHNSSLSIDWSKADSTWNLRQSLCFMVDNWTRRFPGPIQRPNIVCLRSWNCRPPTHHDRAITLISVASCIQSKPDQPPCQAWLLQRQGADCGSSSRSYQLALPSRLGCRSSLLAGAWDHARSSLTFLQYNQLTHRRSHPLLHWSVDSIFKRVVGSRVLIYI